MFKCPFRYQKVLFFCLCCTKSSHVTSFFIRNYQSILWQSLTQINWIWLEFCLAFIVVSHFWESYFHFCFHSVSKNPFSLLSNALFCSKISLPLLLGESGLGKSTLVNSLFLTDLYAGREIPTAPGLYNNYHFTIMHLHYVLNSTADCYPLLSRKIFL